ncbi:unnamed protein product [Pleuronectes platessa]|uniref:Uncharacterized protein n=1 Tax=Pleuronectes platessa TaxID=8262 RepID=A0A9N7V0A4_PLEPL|nr:unnamed protein product [Pleuronectes platessa]
MTTRRVIYETPVFISRTTVVTGREAAETQSEGVSMVTAAAVIFNPVTFYTLQINNSEAAMPSFLKMPFSASSWRSCFGADARQKVGAEECGRHITYF